MDRPVEEGSHRLWAPHQVLEAGYDIKSVYQVIVCFVSSKSQLTSSIDNEVVGAAANGDLGHVGDELVGDGAGDGIDIHRLDAVDLVEAGTLLLHQVLGRLDVGDALDGQSDGLAAGLDGRCQRSTCGRNNGEGREEHRGGWKQTGNLEM